MIRPDELASERPHGPWSCRGCDVWDVLRAAALGDVAALRRLLARDPNLYRAEYWYTRPIHIAVREGHLEAVGVLLEAGADPSDVTLTGDDVVTIARDRGHEPVARLLADARSRRDRAARAEAMPADHAIHAAAASGDVDQVRALVDSDPALIYRRDGQGGTALHRAVAASQHAVIGLLLDRGADIHALHGNGPGNAAGYPAVNFQPIDVALFRHGRGDFDTARLLIARGAVCDIVIAAAFGDLERVTGLLDDDPGRIREARPCGKRALSAAVEFGHEPTARLLLDRGADPNWPEGAAAPQGTALYLAARAGDRACVELLLAHGADPNASIDSSGSATFAASTRELRARLLAHGGTLSAFDLVWLGEDEEVVRRVSADPTTADTGCGGALAAACKLGKRELLVRLLAAGARVPSVQTACRGYLLSDPDMLRLLLASGMNPDLPNWQRATPLHDLCGRDSRGRANPHREACAAILLDAGATISARDEDYRSTPLAWAARCDLPDMVDLLLSRGAPTNLPEDDPWATPLSWAVRRGRGHIAERLQRAGATA
jgi:ankyrin repeat protein